MATAWLLFFSVIPTIIIPAAYAGLRELSTFDRSSVSERTMKSILESCYDHKISSDAVVVVGDFNEFTDKLPMIRIDNFENFRTDSLPYFKPTKVIIIIDSLHELKAKIKSLKGMKWWNHMAFFFIIGKYDRMCNDSSNILLMTIKMNMINSIYICPESTSTSLLYTANQYANYAEHPWAIVEEFNGTTLFSQRFDKNVSCSNLNYDKTIKLDRFTLISVLATSRNKSSRSEVNSIMNSALVPLRTMMAIAEASKIRKNMTFSRERHVAIESISRGKADLMISSSCIGELPTMKFLFPHAQNRIVAIIKSSPEKSIQRKDLYLWSFSITFLVFIALVILFFILSWKNHEFSSALLVSSILKIIRSNLFHISFTAILIIMIISNRVIQSKVATFLTARGERKVIKRMETLIQLGYKFYSTPDLEEMVLEHCPECRATIVAQDQCFNNVLKDGLTACLTEESEYQRVALMPFDLLKKPLFETLMVLRCRDDWPLYDRMNTMWMRSFESGLQIFWKKHKAHWATVLKLRAENFEQSSTRYQPIKFYKLMFAFEFLAVSLSISILVFIAELLVKKYRIPT